MGRGFANMTKGETIASYAKERRFVNTIYRKEYAVCAMELRFANTIKTNSTVSFVAARIYANQNGVKLVALKNSKDTV